MTLRAHPMALLRPRCAERGVAPTAVLKDSKNDDLFTLAGLVLVRQRPGTASGVVFVTIEDEHGIANLVVWPKVFEAHRRIVMGARLLGVRGRIQREGLVIHLVAERLWDWSAELDTISEIDDFRLTYSHADAVRTDSGDRRVTVPEANATRHRLRKGQANPTGYDRNRIVLDRPRIRIASRDFH
jgi:error-prone DNA polymerase